jgi:hypothetical protein
VETVQRTLHANKLVQPVSTGERELVELVMHLADLTTSVGRLSVR